jgi:hypothetical protein
MLPPAREDLEGREGEWNIAATRPVINSVFAEKRWANVTAKKAWEATFFKTPPFKAPEIL